MLHFTLPLPNVLACLSWLLAHHDALICSARLLGGDIAAKRAGRILDAVPRQTTVTRSFLCDLSWLHGLLTLEHVGDPDSDAAAYFSEIDPANPAFSEVCLLAERLGEHIVALRLELHAHRANRAA